MQAAFACRKGHQKTLSAQPYRAPSCWGRQFEENDVECDSCHFRDTCKPQYLKARSIGVAPPPPPPMPIWGQQQHRAPIPVMQPAQTYYSQPAQVIQPPPMPTASMGSMPTQRFWPTQQAYYFEPHAGEGTAERLAKNVALTMGASLFETLGSFFRTWRWPKNQ